MGLQNNSNKTDKTTFLCIFIYVFLYIFENIKVTVTGLVCSVCYKGVGGGVCVCVMWVNL